MLCQMYKMLKGNMRDKQNVFFRGSVYESAMCYLPRGSMFYRICALLGTENVSGLLNTKKDGGEMEPAKFKQQTFCYSIRGLLYEWIMLYFMRDKNMFCTRNKTTKPCCNNLKMNCPLMARKPLKWVTKD